MITVLRACHQAVEGLPDLVLTDGVEVGCCLVEDEDGGVLEEGAGDGYALALTAGKLHSPFADQGVVAFGEGGYEVVGVGLSGGIFDFLLGGVELTQGDVVADAGVEEVGVLGDEGDAVAEGVEPELLEIMVAEGDLAGLGVPEAHKKVGAGGLARPRPSDKGHGLAGFDGEADI